MSTVVAVPEVVAGVGQELQSMSTAFHRNSRRHRTESERSEFADNSVSETVASTDTLATKYRLSLL